MNTRTRFYNGANYCSSPGPSSVGVVFLCTRWLRFTRLLHNAWDKLVSVFQVVVARNESKIFFFHNLLQLLLLSMPYFWPPTRQFYNFYKYILTNSL